MNLEEVKIELTNFCKRKCIHCSSDANNKNIIELSFEDIKKIIDECSKLNVRSIVLTGGEATEYKDIAKVVSYIKSKNINNIKLYTMCEPTIKKYQQLKNLTKLGLNEIIYSLTIPLTTDNAVRFDNIEEFLINISNITKLSFHYCLTTKTIADIYRIDEIISKLNQKNFKSLSFLRYVEHGRGKDDLTLSISDLKKIKPQIIDLINKYKEKIHLGSPFNILNITNTPCTAGSKTIIIGFDGNVYPCDAMKYFDYLGSGGSVYTSSIEEIYNSNYFNKIRNASHNISKECVFCKQENCKGGCLAQKMLEILKRDSIVTTKWYQENALRTMNNFDNLDILKLNAYTGIIGEYGEFFDYIKKLYTHNLSNDKKQEILSLAPKELGDLVWYLTTSLAIFYDYNLNEVYEYILRYNSKSYQIDDNLINKASQNKDPLCPFNTKELGYNIDAINHFLKEEYYKIELNEINILKILSNFKKTLNQLDYIETKEEAIIAVSKILIEIASISKVLFNKNLSEILSDNIEKLRSRYPQGFDNKVANQRIDANKKYKEEDSLRLQSDKSKKRILTASNIDKN